MTMCIRQQGIDILAGADCCCVRTAQGEDHRFDRLAIDLAKLAAQVKLRPLALLGAHEQVMKQCMVGDKFFSDGGNISGGQVRRRSCPFGGALCKRQLLALTFVTHRVSSKLLLEENSPRNQVSL